ncbi:hypothetical protein CL614_04290 [archaeon]|nr:hypothetical protein [archaeon]|tara:strand:- start:634 stop:897 length:264 start_codon:yes stop_codon:yes gene_type:complete
MHPGIKLVIGLIIFLIGIYWYAAPALGHYAIQNAMSVDALDLSTFEAFKVVLSGIFGIALIVFGLVIAWIEYEDLKWERKEKRAKKA